MPLETRSMLQKKQCTRAGLKLDAEGGNLFCQLFQLGVIRA